MNVFNSFQEVQGAAQIHSFNVSENKFGDSVLDKYTSYIGVIPGMKETVERLQERKKQFLAARDVIRELGGDAVSDIPFLNES